MAASSLTGMGAKAQTQRDAVYHIQTMYRGLTTVGALQGLCREYKQAKAQSWKAAGVRGKPRVRPAAHPPPLSRTPTHAMDNALCVKQPPPASAVPPLLLACVAHIVAEILHCSASSCCAFLMGFDPTAALISCSSTASLTISSCPRSALAPPATPVTQTPATTCNPTKWASPSKGHALLAHGHSYFSVSTHLLPI